MESRAAATPVLIYDGNCAFCQQWVDHWQRLTGDRVRYAPFQDVESQYPHISHETFEAGVQFVQPDGATVRNAEAVFTLLRDTPRRAWMHWAYQHVPGFAAVSEWAYKRIGHHRDLAYWAAQILWGDPGPHSYVLTRWLFLRLLGVVFFIAFASLSVQIVGLAGSGGILPVNALMERYAGAFQGIDRFLNFPSLLWLNSSDAMLQLLCIGGMILSVLLILDVLAAPMLLLAYLFYLSLAYAGQNFMSFQWDALLLETGFLAVFLAGMHLIPRLRGQPQPSLTVIYLFRWLLFRLMLGSGMVKLLSGDPTWRNLTALDYHFWTQPLPNPVAWYVAQLPQWVLAGGVLFNFLVELIVPFLYWMPRRIRFVGALLTMALQTMLIVTGNFTFFNLLAIVLCLPLFDDQLLRRGVPKALAARLVDTAGRPGPSWPKRIGLAALTVFILTITYFRFMPTLTDFITAVTHVPVGAISADALPQPISQTLGVAYRLRMAGGYGLFATMTTARPEIVVEGSNDGQTWLAYGFQYKIQDVNQPPPFIAPHQPRLDWQMWFAALNGSYENVSWFPAFAHRLLQGSPEVLALLAHNPFPDAPPKFVRAQIMDYRFTDVSERTQTGAWWTHGPAREFLPVISLESFGPPRP